MFLPKVVLFQMNHMMSVRITAKSTYRGTEVPPTLKSSPLTKSV